MKKSKGMMAGGKMKSKGYAGGGKMKSKGYKSGGKMPMAEKDGEMVPAFLAQSGGKMPNNMPNKMRMSSKMYAAGGCHQDPEDGRRRCCQRLWCCSFSKVWEEWIDGY